MLPQINGKSFLDCTEDDMKALLDNSDYRENDYLDYKQNFAFLEIQDKKDKKEKEKKISEFRSDVCAFANAEGGYLFFGVDEKNGIPSELVGVEIPNDNTDSFELNRRNNLDALLPKTPHLGFHFVKLSNGRYVIIIFVQHDRYAPYTHLEDQKHYFFEKRVGNGKRIMSYTEIKNMFIQSASLEKEIADFRNERIDNYYSPPLAFNSTHANFMLFHIIPDTFTDPNYDKSMYLLEREGVNFSKLFTNSFGGVFSIPCVDGLRFRPDYEPYIDLYQGMIYNSGIVEFFGSLKTCFDGTFYSSEKYPNGYIPWSEQWDKICRVCYAYFELNRNYHLSNKVYLCISLVGCQNAFVPPPKGSFTFVEKTIDRNRLLCHPIECDGFFDEDDNIRISALKQLYIEFLLSLGINNDPSLLQYIKDLKNGNS